MTYLADLASWALGLVRGVSFGFLLLPLLAWSLLSFALAVMLGRAIRRADERAGVLDEPELMAGPVPHVSEREHPGFAGAPDGALRRFAFSEEDGATRREPTRSGPFLIDRGVQASLRAHVANAKRKS